MSGIEFLLDTNVIIGLLKNHEAAVALVTREKLELEKAAVSQITRMELLGYSKLSEDDERTICSFLQACQVLLLDETIEAEAIKLRRSGAFKLPDAIVAATALTHQLRLLTLDTGMIQGLQRLGHEF